MLRSYVILPITSCCQSLKYPALQLPTTCINWLQLTLQALVCLAAPYFVLLLLPAPCSLASQFPLYLLWLVLVTSVYRYCVLALHLHCLLLHLSASIPNLWTVVQSLLITISIVLKPAHFLRHFVLAIHALGALQIPPFKTMQQYLLFPWSDWIFLSLLSYIRLLSQAMMQLASAFHPCSCARTLHVHWYSDC